MKKLVIALAMVLMAGVALANSWNINWSITGAFSPDDTTGAMDPLLLSDYSVTWSLINASAGDTVIASMSALAGSSQISIKDGDTTLAYDAMLMAMGDTVYMGSTSLSSPQDIYQKIEVVRETNGSIYSYFWSSDVTSVTPVADPTSAPVDLKGVDAIIGPQGSTSTDVNTYWQPASTAVPEPATMSLLGLGALAMVIRRKLRK